MANTLMKTEKRHLWVLDPVLPGVDRIVNPTSHEYLRLVESTPDECSVLATPMGRRDRAILLTLLDTRIRCSEAAHLDLADCT